MSQIDVAAAERVLEYDRATGKLSGAGLIDRAAVLALQAGSKLSRPFGHRGYALGCKAVSAAVAKCDIVVKLNRDAAFAIPLADRYWSRLLNNRYHYEEEIEVFLRSIADLKYSFVDCGANFGYWSVLVTSEPFGRQIALAIEASPKNARRLEANSKLNGNRFGYLNAAVGLLKGGFARITGKKHEAFSTVAIEGREDDAVEVISLDSLVADGYLDCSAPIVIKLDVEGVEIDVIRGGGRLLSGNAIIICEDHGSDRHHLVSRYLKSATSLRVYIFDPDVSRFVRVDDMSVLDRVKRYAWVGYNVFATSSPGWEARLLSAQVLKPSPTHLHRCSN